MFVGAKMMPFTGWIPPGCCCRPRVAQVVYFAARTTMFFIECLTWQQFALMGCHCMKHSSVHSGHCCRPMFTRYIAVPSRQSVEPFCAAVCPAIGVPISLAAGWQIQRGPWEKWYRIKKNKRQAYFFATTIETILNLLCCKRFNF